MAEQSAERSAEPTVDRTDRVSGEGSVRPVLRRRSRRHAGEEAQKVTRADCAAADALIAKMLSGQIDPMSIVVAAPRQVLGVVVDEK